MINIAQTCFPFLTSVGNGVKKRPVFAADDPEVASSPTDLSWCGPFS